MKLYARTLSPSSLYKLAEQLQSYADSLPNKIEMFLSALADRGIEVAKQNEGDFAGYIVYSKEFSADGNSYVMRIVATDRTSITNSWYSSDSPNAEIRSDTFSPLLMAEFGSGRYQNTDPVDVGRLPGSMGHGGNAEGWYWWSDEQRDGEFKHTGKNGLMLFHSVGTPPSMPMHEAVKAIINDVESIARSIFQ